MLCSIFITSSLMVLERIKSGLVKLILNRENVLIYYFIVPKRN